MRKLPFDKDEPDDDESKFAWFYSDDDDDDDFEIDIDQEIERIVESRIRDVTSEFMMEMISREQERQDHISQESLKSAVDFVNGSFWTKFLPLKYRIKSLIESFVVMQEIFQYNKERDIEVDVQKIEHVDESVENDKE